MTTHAARERLRATAAALRTEADALERLADECGAGPAVELVSPPAGDLRAWYIRRAATLVRSGEADDRHAAAAAGFAASREAIRELRRELAPEAWSRPGRRTPGNLADISPSARLTARFPGVPMAVGNR